MSGSLSEDSSVGRSSEGNSSTQRCQSSEALSEWRSCEQVENGTPSTSPPYWDIDDDDDDSGPKPSQLYGKFTWKIDGFSQISKRELRSNAFEVGGYKWYILIYPQGCDVCNHLSLFLCVANHDKLLPGWSHFAQFTIAVVNKDPKKSKYSDTLHRFWKKEHDWGWKKFMELSKVLDGFIVGDTLVIKAQVQVIREKSHRPFRCLDCQYRRELVRVYLTNVEQICRRFVDEKKAKLVGVIENKLQWSSFCTFWLEVDQNVRRRMSREKTDVVLREVVKHFFVEKEVTSTLVMDSLYSGLKALESQSKGKKGRSKVPDTVETSAPMVCVEKDMFTLADDVLLLLERAAIEPLPPKDEKGPQNRTKEGSSGEDFNKDSIERDERRLTELGRRTVEIFVLTTIFRVLKAPKVVVTKTTSEVMNGYQMFRFPTVRKIFGGNIIRFALLDLSTKIDVAYKEAVAFKRQEELIREEEAGQAGSEQKAKRGATEKEKRAKKKQSKLRRSSRKGKDKARDEKFEVSLEGKPPSESPMNVRSGEEFSANQTVSTIEKPGSIDDVSDVSDTADDATEMLQPDLEDRDASPVNWDTDTSEVHPATESSSSGLSGLPIQNGRAGKNNTSVMDDSSSTCSTDSVPSVVMNASYRGNSIAHYKSQTSASRRKNQRCKEARDRTGWAHDINSQDPEPAVDADRLRDLSGSCRAVEPESVLSLKDQIHWLDQHSIEKEEVVPLQKKLIVNDPVDVERPSGQRMALEAAVTSTPTSPARNPPSGVQPKPVAGRTNQGDLLQVKETPSSSPRQAEKVVPRRIPSPHIPAASKPEVHNPAVPLKPIPTASEKATASMSRPSSAPLVPGPRPAAAVVSMAAPTPLLSRSMSAAGRLGVDTAPATPSYAPQSYRNAIMGKTMGANPAGFTSHPSCSAVSPSQYSQPPSGLTSQPTALVSQPMHLPQNSGRMDQGLVRPGFTFGSVTPEVLHNQPQWLEGSQKDANKILCNPSLLKGIQNLDIYGSGGGSSGTYFSDEPTASTTMRQAQGVGVSSDEFPHLDIINYLLDEEHSIGSAVFGPNIGHHHPLNRQYTFPGDMPLSMDVGPSANSCRFERQESYLDDGLRQVYGSPSGPYDGYRDIVPLVGLPYANGQIDGMMQSQWPIGNADLSMLNYRNSDSNGYLYQVPEYSNVACGVNGYPLFRPANGH